MSVSLIKSLPADVLLIVFKHVACVHDQRSFIRSYSMLWRLMRPRREYRVLLLRCLKTNYQEYCDRVIDQPQRYGRVTCDMCYTSIRDRNYAKHCLQKCVRRVEFKWQKCSMIYLMRVFERRYNAHHSHKKSITIDLEWCKTVYSAISSGTCISEYLDHNTSTGRRCLWCGVVQCHVPTLRCPVAYYCNKLGISHTEIK